MQHVAQQLHSTQLCTTVAHCCVAKPRLAACCQRRAAHDGNGTRNMLLGAQLGTGTNWLRKAKTNAGSSGERERERSARPSTTATFAWQHTQRVRAKCCQAAADSLCAHRRHSPRLVLPPRTRSLPFVASRTEPSSCLRSCCARARASFRF